MRRTKERKEEATNRQTKKEIIDLKATDPGTRCSNVQITFSNPARVMMFVRNFNYFILQDASKHCNPTTSLNIT